MYQCKSESNYIYIVHVIIIIYQCRVQLEWRRKREHCSQPATHHYAWHDCIWIENYYVILCNNKFMYKMQQLYNIVYIAAVYLSAGRPGWRLLAGVVCVLATSVHSRTLRQVEVATLVPKRTASCAPEVALVTVHGPSLLGPGS